MRRGSRARRWVCASCAVMLFAVLGGRSVKAEPEIHQKLAPLEPWMSIADDPSKADSVWTSLGAALPTFADSAQRGFGWYLMFSAATALGHVDSMRVAAESSFVYSPNDLSGFRELAHYLSRAQHHLDLALACATKVVETKNQPIPHDLALDDLRWLGYIQLQLGQDSAAAATFEERLKRDSRANAWTSYRLGRIYARTARPDLAIERLTQGLAAVGQDPKDSTQARNMLDSLLAARGGDRDAAQTRIAEARAKAERRYWLEDWREDRPAPKAAFVDLRGAPTASPRDQRGLTVVYAWATWCGPCRKSLPALQAWASRSRTKPVRVLTVNAEGEPLTEARDKVAKFVASQGLQLPVIMADSVAAARWRLGSFPTTLVLQDGRIVYRNHAADLVTGLEAQLATLGSRPKD